MLIPTNLGEVKEKEKLPVGTYTFSVRKATVAPNKAGDGVNVNIELRPDEDPEQALFHVFSLKPGALSSSSATMSLAKFLRTLGYAGSESNFQDSEALLGLRFRASVKHEIYNNEPRPKLESILGVA